MKGELPLATPTFVPPEPFRHPAVTGNPHVTTVVSDDGGHCAFVERLDGEYDGYWAEREVVRFVSAQAGLATASSPRAR